jgi:hypothetical protein
LKGFFMKKYVMMIVLLLCSVTMAEDGISIWGLTTQDADALKVRVGYEKDNIEGFIGSQWWPGVDVVTGEVKPPQVITLGALYHFSDLLDPNNPLPFIPDILMAFMPPGTVAEPYVGGQATFNLFDKDAGLYAALAGLLIKAQPDSKVAIVAEAEYGVNFAQLSVLPEFKVNLGFRYKF